MLYNDRRNNKFNVKREKMRVTKVFKGENCIKENPDTLILGSRALVVTGKNSAKVSGALADVTDVLNQKGIKFTVYDKMVENPTVESCIEAAQLGREFGADFIIGIGGGSPLDACKAVSTFAAMPSLTVEGLYDTEIKKVSLPIAAIPLTAGTGSEVDKNSVLTLNNKKKTYIDDSVFPINAYLDPRYLKTLNSDYTVATAIDAFCHCIESYLSPKSTPDSEKEALKGGKLIWDALTQNDFLPNDTDKAGLSPETRLSMLEGAACGGLALTVTGTGFTHPLGYGLSLYHGIPHGKACGCFTGKYVELNMTTEEGKARLTAFASHIGTTPEIIAAVIPALSDVNLALSEEEILDMAAKVAGAKNYVNSPYVLTDEKAVEIMTELLGNC